MIAGCVADSFPAGAWQMDAMYGYFNIDKT
jgi:hypothetical protein